MQTLSAEAYFIRFRGRVTGPVAIEALRRMAQQGTLSRFHELSADQQKWFAAQQFWGLFRADGDVEQPARVQAPLPLTSTAPAPAATGLPQYYYSRGAATIGPVALEVLQTQAARGALHATDPVWPEGSRNALMAAELPALAGIFSATANRQNHVRGLLIVGILVVAVVIVGVGLFLLVGR